MIYIISVLFLLCFCSPLFIDALWSPAGKELTSRLSFAMSNLYLRSGEVLDFIDS